MRTKLITSIILGLIITNGSVAQLTITLASNSPSITNDLSQQAKPKWLQFTQKYLTSTLTALGIGATTGCLSGIIHKKWVRQNGSDLRCLINIVGSSLVHWRLVNRINEGFREAEIPHDPELITDLAWITSWVCYFLTYR